MLNKQLNKLLNKQLYALNTIYIFYRVCYIYIAPFPMIVEHSSRIIKTLGDMHLEQINLGYSLKNIPIPSSKQYIKCLIEKVDSFINEFVGKYIFLTTLMLLIQLITLTSNQSAALST